MNLSVNLDFIFPHLKPSTGNFFDISYPQRLLKSQHMRYDDSLLRSWSSMHLLLAFGYLCMVWHLLSLMVFSTSSIILASVSNSSSDVISSEHHEVLRHHHEPFWLQIYHHYHHHHDHSNHHQHHKVLQHHHESSWHQIFLFVILLCSSNCYHYYGHINHHHYHQVLQHYHETSWHQILTIVIMIAIIISIIAPIINSMKLLFAEMTEIFLLYDLISPSVSGSISFFSLVDYFCCVLF